MGVSEAEARRRLAKDLLPHISGLVQEHTRLLDGQAVQMHRVLLSVWTLRNGVFTESQKELSTDGKLRRDLYHLFREKPFPFRRCPVCQTIFVPVRRQLYCTPTCTYKGTEIARKEEKREYMRDYMEKRRKKAKRKIHLVNKEKEGQSMPKYKHGSGTVYLRGKTWWITYSVNGKQIWESAKTKDKAEARRLLRAKMGQIAEGRYAGPESERLTFDDLAELLFTDYHVNGKKTLRETKVRVERHLRPFFGMKKAHEISTADVQMFIVKRQADRATNGEINRETAALKRAFNLAIQAEKLLKKPYMQRLEEKNVRQGFFEPWQFDALLSKLPDSLRPPITFAYWTGWRLYSEVLSLTWEQVDFDAGTVRLLPGTTKNGEGRVLFLTPELKALMEEQWTAHRTHFPHCSLVFHRNGKRIKDVHGPRGELALRRVFRVRFYLTLGVRLFVKEA